jgi:dihydroorotase-like cyclic amidohydrolase
MVRLGLISRHIVLTESTDKRFAYPLEGVILIEDEIIIDIVITDSNVTIEGIKTLYNDWNLVDYSDYYISPGIIDLNTRVEWETYASLTREAVKGGVTVVVVEPGYYNSNIVSNELYCDLVQVQVMDENTSFDDLPNDIGVLKGYLYPPSTNIKSIINLDFVIHKSQTTGLPVFLDPSLPDPRMLYLASPLRLENYEERNKANVSSSTVFAGAFPEAMEKSSDSESCSDADDPPPLKATSLQTEEIKKIFNHHRSISDEEGPNLQKFLPGIVISEENEIDSSPKVPLVFKSKKIPHNIYNDLDSRIRASQQNIEDLCIAERSTYSYSGSTSFIKIDVPKKSASLSLLCVQTEEPGPPLLQSPSSAGRVGRPAPIQIKTEIKPDVSKEYTYYLANYPEHWECNGIEKVLDCINSNYKIHFCSMSSAAAINKVRQARKKFQELTCEISIPNLYFTSASVLNGDTRFKNNPPIRNPGNCNLLWDLLKMKGVDCISSSHAFISTSHKITGNFQQALNGISSIGCTLQSVWHVLNLPVSKPQQLEHYIVRLSKWLSLYPAKVLKLDSKRGSIDIGKYADLIVWNPWERYRLNQTYAYESTSPFVNQELMGKIYVVYIRGKVVFQGFITCPLGKIIIK